MTDPGNLSRLGRALYRAVGLGPVLDFLGNAADPTDPVAFTREMSAAYRVRTTVRWLGDDSTPVERTVYCCTHPTGATDFLGAFGAISARVDRLLVPMHPSICRLTPLSGIGVPTWPPSHERASVPAGRRLVRHLLSGGNVMVFPAGRVGSLVDGRVRDDPWRPALRQLTAAGRASVVPVLVDARNSRAFYALRARFRRLGLPFMLRELVRGSDAPVRIAIGRPIPGAEIPADPVAGMEWLRSRCYTLESELPPG